MAYHGGTLRTISALRARPLNSLGGIAANARKIEPVELRIPVLDTRGVAPTNKELSVALAFCLSRFYNEEGQQDINPGKLGSMAVGILAHFANFSTLAPWGIMKGVFSEAGLSLVFTRATPQDFANLSVTDRQFRDFLEMFGDDLDYYLTSTPLMVIISSIILVASAKNITPQGYNNWLKNRIRGFCGTVGWEQLNNYLSAALCPSLAVMSAYNSFCSANFKVRRQLFLTIFSLANNVYKNSIVLCCTEVINLMRGTEMQHIIMIDRMLYEKYNELLHLNCMKGLSNVMGAAVAYLNTLAPEEVMFARLLKDKDESALLNRNLFDFYSTVATAAAQYENSSFDNYYISDTPSHQRIALAVKRYLMQRDKLLGVSAIERKEANATETEKNVVVLMSRNIDYSWYYKNFANFSKIVNFICWSRRFMFNCQKYKKRGGVLSTENDKDICMLKPSSFYPFYTEVFWSFGGCLLGIFATYEPLHRL